MGLKRVISSLHICYRYYYIIIEYFKGTIKIIKAITKETLEERILIEYSNFKPRLYSSI